MTTSVLEIVAANALMLATGVGLLPILGVAKTRRELVRRIALAYPVGLAATGILSATLVVVDVPIGWPSLGAAAALALAVGHRSVGFLPAGRGPARRHVLGRLSLVAAAAFLVEASRLLAVRPLSDNDAWQIWGLRAEALYDFGRPVSPIFTAPQYPELQHPLLLSALQALDAHAIGRWDGTLLHLQLAGFALAFVLGGWGLLRDRASSSLLGLTLLAVLTAPSFFAQLQTNYADIPLAVFAALGVAALGVWLSARETSALALAALFLGAAALTKNEGEMFALAAFVAAAIVCGRARLPALALAALAALLADLPWRIWLAVNHVRITDFSLATCSTPAT